jgi:enamine deaminase RidA (YjgF/YER057c/UK114 family)
MDEIEQKLLQLGLSLPNVPRPIASFVPFSVSNGLVFLAGQTCERNGEMVYRGRVGVDVNLESARKGAELCALNLLAALRDACGGSLSRVARCLRVGGYVQAEAGYERVPAVINGASDLFIALWGDAGRHARTAIGVATLPQNATVEVDAIFELRGGA